MEMTPIELREAHDKLDGARVDELEEFKALTAEHRDYVAGYKAAKQALPRRSKDEDEVVS